MSACWPKSLPYRKTGERVLRLDLAAIDTIGTTYQAHEHARWYETPSAYEIWVRTADSRGYFPVTRVSKLRVMRTWKARRR